MLSEAERIQTINFLFAYSLLGINSLDNTVARGTVPALFAYAFTVVTDSMASARKSVSFDTFFGCLFFGVLVASVSGPSRLTEAPTMRAHTMVIAIRNISARQAARVNGTTGPIVTRVTEAVSIMAHSMGRAVVGTVAAFGAIGTRPF